MVAVAVAVSIRDIRASTLEDIAWSVAYATGVEFTHTVVYVVADAVGISISGTSTTTHAQSVELVAVAIAIPFWDRSTTAGVYCTGAVANTAGVKCAYTFVHVVANAISIHIGSTSATTHAQGIKLVAIAIAVPNGNVRTAALVDVSWTVANITNIKFANTIVHIVANAIDISVGSTSTATNAQGI